MTPVMSNYFHTSFDWMWAAACAALLAIPFFAPVPSWR